MLKTRPALRESERDFRSTGRQGGRVCLFAEATDDKYDLSLKSPRSGPVNVNMPSAATVSQAGLAEMVACRVRLFVFRSVLQAGSVGCIGPSTCPHEASFVLL